LTKKFELQKATKVQKMARSSPRKQKVHQLKKLQEAGFVACIVGIILLIVPILSANPLRCYL
jgi:hypothetical protein